VACRLVHPSKPCCRSDLTPVITTWGRIDFSLVAKGHRVSYAGVIGLEPQGAFLSGWKGLGRFWLISLGLLCSAVLAIATIGPRERQPVVAMLTKAIPPAEPKPVLHPAPVAAPVLPPAPPVERDPTPKVAVLVSGMGLSTVDTSAAIETLPAGISLAVSPYADAAKLLPDIRAHGHEALVAVPMEPEGNPLNDPDSSTALMTSLTETENMTRLRAVLAKA
jgi:hypothetical protein